MTRLENYLYTDNKRHFLDLRNKRIESPIDLVLFGDSITEGFNLSRYFATNKVIVNSAIGGDRLTFMINRIYQDVIDLKPKNVFMMGGINDIRAWYKSGLFETTFDNPLKHNREAIINHVISHYQKAALIFKDNNINIFMAKIIHINEENLNNFFINQLIDEINDKLETILEAENIILIDFNSVLDDDNNNLQKSLADDGLHPNDYGYLKMSEIFKQEIIDKI